LLIHRRLWPRAAGRHEGFRKILRLLLVNDADLTQEIVRTIRHLLDVPQVRPQPPQTYTTAHLSGSPMLAFVWCGA